MNNFEICSLIRHCKYIHTHTKCVTLVLSVFLPIFPQLIFTAVYATLFSTRFPLYLCFLFVPAQMWIMWNSIYLTILRVVTSHNAEADGNSFLCSLSLAFRALQMHYTHVFFHRVASIQSTQRYECVYVLKMNKNTRTRLRIQCDPLIVHIFFVVDGSSFSILFCAIHSVSMHCKNAFCASFLEKM